MITCIFLPEEKRAKVKKLSHINKFEKFLQKNLQIKNIVVPLQSQFKDAVVVKW